MRRTTAILALLLTAGSAGEEPPSRDEELAAIRGEIVRLEAELERARAEEMDLTGALRRTRLEVALQEERVAEAVTARDLVAADLAATEAEVAALAERLQRLQRQLEDEVVWLYRLGRSGYLRLVVSITTRDDFLPVLRTVRFLALRTARLRQDTLDTAGRLADQREALTRERADLDAWVEREASRSGELERIRRRQQYLLTRAGRERSELAARAGVLADKERKLARLLDALYGRSGEPLGGTPITEFRGALDWPARGAVVTRFGPRLDPRYGTRLPHNGVDIALASGAEVRAVFPGKVLFAAPFAGYGPTAVVHHPGRVFTLYAGLAALRVGEGDVLSLGQVIGTAAGDLYFEIREENRPQDPLSWLR